MIKEKYQKFLAYIFFGYLFFPKFVFAQTTLTPQQRCDNFKAQFKGIYSMMPDYYCTANGTLLQVINLGLIFAGTISILLLILGGFWYVTSAGNEEQSEKGKKTIINSIIGLVVIIMATVIVRIVAGVITQ